MSIERKGVNVLTAEIKAAKSDDGGYNIVLSMPTVDRDGEIVDAKAFDPLPPGRIPIDVDHGMTVLTTVGSGVAEYVGDTLTLRDFRFASTPLGKDVRTLVDEDHVSKMSVAFMDAVREVDEDDGLPHVRQAELLNAAIVAIPSNREASILAAKAAIALTGAEVIDRSEKIPASVPGDFVTSSGSARNFVTTASARYFDAMRDGTLLVDDIANTSTIAPLNLTSTSHVTKSPAVCPTCGQVPAVADPEETAAEAAVPLADALLAQALTELSLVEADLALE